MPERAIIQNAKIIVIKLGTSVLTGGADALDEAYVHDMALEIARLVDAGKRIVVVSSGAVGVGMGVLGLDRRPTEMRLLQAAAAAGQPELLRLWSNAFAACSQRVAQVLVCRSDFDERNRFLNIRNCLTSLLSAGVIPIVNENDAVATEEIALGDNDVLSSKVAHAIGADALLLLTSAQGVCDASNNVIPRVERARELEQHIRPDATAQGTGGMRTKIDAADAATRAGIVTLIGPGRPAERLRQITTGEPVGTLIAHRQDRPPARDAWLGLSATPLGTIVIDEGAERALRERGASLLAKGVVSVSGVFGTGDVVRIESVRGQAIANGLSNLAHWELLRVKGLPSDELPGVLGREAQGSVVHRDNLTLYE